MASLIEVKGLKTYFYTYRGVVRAVDGADFSIESEKALGVVGESGSGKSVTALSIMGLIEKPGKLESGEILYRQNGNITDLSKLDSEDKIYRSIRGKEISMIFQEPMISLNPVYTIGNQIMEAIILHQKVGKKEARMRALAMLKAVGFSLPSQRIDEYPHQLSGGMRQRAMIAMAISCKPKLLIADEPTTALDVTVEAQVLSLISDLRKEFKMALMLITHDLGVVANMADEVIVMYLGKIVENSSVRNIFHNTKHPYTHGLMNSIPSLTTKKDRLIPIAGNVPDSLIPLPGCCFESRCPQRMAICKGETPPLKQVASGHKVACWLYN